MARVRIVIEYDLDLEEGAEATAEDIRAEEQAWANEEITYQDLIGARAYPTIVASKA